jgi:DNA-binding NarL/FixJ family response regulator
MNQARQVQIEQRREQVLDLHRQGMNHNDMASELSVSVATIKRDLKALNGSVKK